MVVMKFDTSECFHVVYALMIAAFLGVSSNHKSVKDRLFIKLEGQESLCPVNIQFVLNEDIADRTYAFCLYVIIIQRFNMTKKIICMKNKRNILFHHARSWQHPISKSLLSNISKKSSKILSHWEIYPRKEAR